MQHFLRHRLAFENGLVGYFKRHLAVKKGQLALSMGQLAPGRPFCMGLPIASGSLPVPRLTDVACTSLLLTFQMGRHKNA